jgi:anthranilate synthase component 1
MVRPDRDSFRALAQRGAVVPLVREVLADLDTPLSLFLKLDDGVSSFLFESVEGGEDWSRFSIIGLGARARFTARGTRLEIERGERRETIELPADRSRDPLEHLRGLLEELRPVELPDLPAFAGGAVGYLAHDWVRYVERLPDANPDPLGVPDCFFVFPEVVLIHDRHRQRLSIIYEAQVPDPEQADAAYDAGLERIEEVLRAIEQPLPPTEPPPADPEPVELRSNVTRERYHEMVKRAKDYIQAGDVFQVVPSQRFTAPLRSDPRQIYRWLRVINPSPYLFFLRCGDHVVLGSSPETHVRLEDGEIILRPIAGTRPRGASEEEDQALERELLSDPKELAEHIMLVDLGRNDVGRVAEIGSVRVDELKVIERYSHVMHIVSNVRGRLAEGYDAIDLLRATFPAGTLTGAPKVRAMEIIDELEPERRGLYGGCVGYIDHRGNMDSCIVIRTLLIKDGQIYAQAGGGVVADSDPQAEYEESLHKARAVLRAIELAGGGSLA